MTPPACAGLLRPLRLSRSRSPWSRSDKSGQGSKPPKESQLPPVRSSQTVEHCFFLHGSSAAQRFRSRTGGVLTIHRFDVSTVEPSGPIITLLLICHRPTRPATQRETRPLARTPQELAAKRPSAAK
jgi:hypothetical protein